MLPVIGLIQRYFGEVHPDLLDRRVVVAAVIRGREILCEEGEIGGVRTDEILEVESPELGVRRGTPFADVPLLGDFVIGC